MADYNYEPVFALQAEALVALESKARALRKYLELHEGDAPEEEKRLATIEGIIAEIYGRVR